jgi:putative flavoprotein involved in K+ transport
MVLDAVVVGGGQAGLASGYWLKRAGLSFAILEARGRMGGSWTSYYESLALFSPARYSSLPGMPFPGPGGRYPARDEVVGYLADYAARFELPVQLGTPVIGVDRGVAGFEIHLADGGLSESRAVISATGSFEHPYVPDLPGAAEYGGELLHSSSYRNPTGYQGRRVIVVGAGDSAVQIAVELARVAGVTIATRSPVRFAPQRTLGLDMHFWLKWLGTDRRPIGNRRFPVVDAGGYRAALKAARPDRRPMFKRLTATGVEWADGQHEDIDVVILATGYRPSLEWLGGFKALDDSGHARQKNGSSTSIEGLYFVGYEGLRNFASGTLRGSGADAKIVVQRLVRALRGAA